MLWHNCPSTPCIIHSDGSFICLSTGHKYILTASDPSIIADSVVEKQSIISQVALTVDPSCQHKDLILSKHLPAGEASQALVMVSSLLSSRLSRWSRLSVYLRHCGISGIILPLAVWQKKGKRLILMAMDTRQIYYSTATGLPSLFLFVWILDVLHLLIMI